MCHRSDVLQAFSLSRPTLSLILNMILLEMEGKVILLGELDGIVVYVSGYGAAPRTLTSNTTRSSGHGDFVVSLGDIG